MIRLFLKLYGVLIATLALSFVVQMHLMDYVWRQTSQGFDFRVRFAPTFHLIEEALIEQAPSRSPVHLLPHRLIVRPVLRPVDI